MFEILLVVGELLRNRENGQVVRSQFNLDIGTLCDPQRVVTTCGLFTPEIPHLFRCLEIVLVAFKSETVLVTHERTGLHTEQCVVSLMVGLIDIVRIIGCEKWCANLVCDLNQLGVRAQLICNAVVLHFNEQIVFTEDVLQAARFGDGSLFVAVEK